MVVVRQGAYLDVLDYTVVAKVAARSVARGGEGIGGNVQQRAVAAIGDVERSDRDCGRLAGAWLRRQDEKRREEKRRGEERRAYIWSGRADTGRLHRRLCCGQRPWRRGGCGDARAHSSGAGRNMGYSAIGMIRGAGSGLRP